MNAVSTLGPTHLPALYARASKLTQGVPVNTVRWVMKTTIDIPDPLFRKAKATAAERGQSLRELVSEALQEKLAGGGGSPGGEPPWMDSFGKLRRLRTETRKVGARIAAEFDQIEPEDRA